jgi:hypothetical protein
VECVPKEPKMGCILIGAMEIFQPKLLCTWNNFGAFSIGFVCVSCVKRLIVSFSFGKSVGLKLPLVPWQYFQIAQVPTNGSKSIIGTYTKVC